MKIEKKYIIAASIGVVSIAGLAMYLQYKKLMNYCLGFNKIKVKAITASNADFDIYLNFKNNSKIKIEIESQEYSVYINDVFVTKASNASKQVIKPESTSIIGVNVKFNPASTGKKILDTLLGGKINIKVDTKLKVKLWFFNVTIPYVYETTLKELLTPSPLENSSVKCR